MKLEELVSAATASILHGTPMALVVPKPMIKGFPRGHLLSDDENSSLRLLDPVKVLAYVQKAVKASKGKA